ncbi:beta-lactamase-like protein [Cladochytrium replicatum]|nr:beta-lactamase-like protein [Cladochytrium replicatum]
MLPRSALAGATLRRESFPSPISSRQLRDGEVLKLEDDRGQNSTTLKVIAAPGHTATSAAFYIPEEDSLFTGDAVSSSPLVNDTALTARPAHTAVEDVEAYSYTLSKLRNIMPKLIFPGHGELITNGFKHIDEAIDAIRDLDRRVLAILLERKGCSGEVIAKEIAKQCKADQNEELILQGTVRQVLLGLERRKLVKRKEVVKDPYAVSGGLDPTRIKGPGGLTMDQIFSKIQDSRRADWNSAAERKGGPQLSDAINLRRQQHPVHLKIPCSLDVAWETL